MSGFVEQQYDTPPKGKGRHRKVRTLWRTVKQTTGSPPTLIHYMPARRWYEIDGERVFTERATWVIHHKTGRFIYTGTSPEIVQQIHTDGLTGEA